MIHAIVTSGPILTEGRADDSRILLAISSTDPKISLDHSECLYLYAEVGRHTLHSTITLCEGR